MQVAAELRQAKESSDKKIADMSQQIANLDAALKKLQFQHEVRCDGCSVVHSTPLLIVILFVRDVTRRSSG